jgi:hypothetical protein
MSLLVDYMQEECGVPMERIRSMMPSRLHSTVTFLAVILLVTAALHMKPYSGLDPI